MVNNTNGELVMVKSVCTNGEIELADGRELDSSFREFLPGDPPIMNRSSPRDNRSFSRLQRLKSRQFKNNHNKCRAEPDPLKFLRPRPVFRTVAWYRVLDIPEVKRFSIPAAALKISMAC